ncbi:hypothetical protein [Peribacillus simplex]|uniref:hypothetical protein n=1 Tax=Peribacillus simplex TaxID=1478 RepID=UPI003CF84627
MRVYKTSTVGHSLSAGGPGAPSTRFSRRSLAPSVQSTVLDYPSWFFTVILNGWKKFATLLPNNWLAETPQTLALMGLGRQSAERERISEINWNVF